MTKAVILAAGAGSRLGPLGAATPKPLLPIDGRDPGCTFLDWHLRALAAAGVGEIYLVGSPRTAGTRLATMANVRAEWILNPTVPPAVSGSAHSARFAWASPHRILDGRSPVILMDADVVYDPSLLVELLAVSAARSTMLVATEHRTTGEEVLVFVDPARPTVARRLGKHLTGMAAVAGLACAGEATGIVLWHPADHAALAAATDAVLAASLGSEHEDATARLMAEARLEVLTFGPERPFLEVDTEEDYRRLVDVVAPRLLGRGGVR